MRVSSRAISFMMNSFADVPDEIIRHILHFITPEDILDSVQLVSHRFYRVAKEPLLWRWLCLETFKYWHPYHRIEAKVAAPAPSIDWRALWIARSKKNAGIARLFERILSTNQSRLKHIQLISQLGYDAKDYLLEQLHCHDSKEDVLVRRYYAGATLDSLHKGVAIDLWYQYQGHPLCIRGLDRALAAFDVCVVRDQPHDPMGQVVRTLDDYAERFRREHPGFDSLTTREQAVALVRWLRHHNIVGFELPDSSYHNLRNCFIGHALSEDSHPSLPTISSSIYVCVAERLGLVSTCLAFPSHVHAVVYAPPGEDVDGNPVPDPDLALGRVYIDPYGSDYEVTVDDLRARLIELGWSRHMDTFLQPSPVPAVVQRTAQSIKTTWAQASTLRDGAPIELSRLRTGLPPGFDLNRAYEAALWADLLSRQADHPQWDVALEDLLGGITRDTPEDAWLLKKYVVPLYDRFAEAWPDRVDRNSSRNPRNAVNWIENLDSRIPEVSRRYTKETRTKVLYKIGQVFRHKRYRYIGIINGWTCQNHAMPSPAPFRITPEDAHDLDGLDALVHHSPQRMEMRRTGARHRGATNPDKVFYTCMRPGYDHLRLNQENVEIITDPDLIPEQLFVIAGKYFKRFDRQTCTFVSNIKERYPDD